jgi:hypothetical protein
MPGPPAVRVTLALTVTVCEYLEGLGADASTVEVVPAGFTVWVTGEDVEPVKLASPEYSATTL